MLKWLLKLVTPKCQKCGSKTYATAVFGYGKNPIYCSDCPEDGDGIKEIGKMIGKMDKLKRDST